jgi:hypothetical protein
MLARDHVELFPMMMSEDWQYAFRLAMQYDPKNCTEELLVREWLTTGFQAFVCYVNGRRAGVAFSKHWADGLSLDGYVDYDVLPKGTAVWHSLTVAGMMMEHLHRFSDKVYAIFRKKELRLGKMVRALKMDFVKEWKEFFVFVHIKPVELDSYCTPSGVHMIGA